MAKYFKLVRKEVDAEVYCPKNPIEVATVVHVPGTQFGVLVQSEHRGAIVRGGDVVVNYRGRSSVKSGERFFGEYSKDNTDTSVVHHEPTMGGPYS